MPASPSLTVAHISDLHVLDLRGVGWQRYLNKRATGLANLAGARRGAHPIAVAEALGDAVRAAGAEHVLLTGDISNLALEPEFERARSILDAMGGPEFITLIPGNHDAYTRGAVRHGRFERVFADYLVRPDGRPIRGRQDYPLVRDIAPHVRVYGLSSAIPTPPICSYGDVGSAQLDRLRTLAAAEPVAVAVRIVLVHHNLHPRGPLKDRTSRLRDRDQLAAALRDIGATVLLHGHTHTPNQWHLPGEPPVYVLGSGSSTWAGGKHPDNARFNILRIGADGLLDATAWRWSTADAAFAPERDDLLQRALERPLQL